MHGIVDTKIAQYVRHWFFCRSGKWEPVDDKYIIFQYDNDPKLKKLLKWLPLQRSRFDASDVEILKIYGCMSGQCSEVLGQAIKKKLWGNITHPV